MRIAICQIRVVDSDVEGNFARIEAAARDARHHHADIACFPEASLIGWGNPRAAELAHPIPGAHSARLARIAKEHELMLCGGLHEIAAGKLYNAALLIDRDGTLLHHHRKINLIGDGVEAPPTVQGGTDGLKVVETRHGRIGLLICADSFIAGHRRILAAQQPALMLIPYAWAAPAGEWPQHGEELWKVIAQNADEIGCPVVGTDGVGAMTAGPWRDWIIGGCSAVYWPGDEFHMRFPYGQEGVWVVDI